MARRCDWDAPLVLALLVWLCALPLVGVVILPTFGIQVAVIVAAGLLVLMLLICWALCWTADDGPPDLSATRGRMTGGGV